MSYARVVTSESGQRIELPADVRLAVDEVEIRRDGDSVVLTPVPNGGKKFDVEELQRILRQIPDDVFEAVHEARRRDRGRTP